MRLLLVLTGGVALSVAVPSFSGASDGRWDSDLMASSTTIPVSLAKQPDRRFFEPDFSVDQRFVSRARGFVVSLDRQGAIFDVRAPVTRSGKVPNGASTLSGSAPRDLLRLRFVDAEPGSALSGVDPRLGKTRYYKPQFGGRGPIPTFQKVRHNGVYPGVDVVYRFTQGELEYDFLVAPRADPSRIRLAFDGALGVSIDAAGHLLIGTGAGTLRQDLPVVYQETADGRREIPASYRLGPEGQVGFQIAAYDASRPLIIDPVLSVSGFLGGSGVENGRAIAVDAAGNVYVTGLTESVDFPTLNAPDGDLGDGDGAGEYDVFVTKLDSAGNVVFSTYLGGSGNESARGIALGVCLRDPAFCTAPGATATDYGVYITGTTLSQDFPLSTDPVQGQLGVKRIYDDMGREVSVEPTTDAFVVKLDATTGAVAYATYLGGSGSDSGRAIAVDDLGQAHVVGTTHSTDFHRVNALPKTLSDENSSDLFVAKLGQQGNALAFSTYLGGAGDDIGAGIALDSAGAVYVAGSTASADLFTAPTYKTYQAGTCRNDRTENIENDDTSAVERPCRDAFIAKLTSAGALELGTYLGGAEDDFVAGIALDQMGNVYVSGSTLSPGVVLNSGQPLDQSATAQAGSFPLYQPIGSDFTDTRSFEAFVTTFDSGLSSILYSTFLHGGDYDVNNTLAVTGSGAIYLAGHTWSTDFPLKQPFQATMLAGDAYIAKIEADGTLGYASYLGGTAIDYIYGLAVDGAGSAYVAGGTWSANFPVTSGSGLAPGFGGGKSDAFVARVDEGGAVADVAVSVAADRSSLKANELLTYAIDVTNNSTTATATGTRLVIDVPVWASVTSPPSGCVLNEDEGTVSCQLGDLGPGTVEPTRFLSVKPTTGGTLVTAFGVMSQVADDQTSNNNVNVRVEVSRLSRSAALDPMSILLLSLAALCGLVFRLKTDR